MLHIQIHGHIFIFGMFSEYDLNGAQAAPPPLPPQTPTREYENNFFIGRLPPRKRMTSAGAFEWAAASSRRATSDKSVHRSAGVVVVASVGDPDLKI